MFGRTVGYNKFKTGLLAIMAGLAMGSVGASSAYAVENATETQKITILGTSDVHGQLWNWSYEDDVQTAVGLSQVSTVVKNVRAENPGGTILIDNGDMMQGTILTDDLYNKQPLFNEPNPMITAMNYINYDAMVLGNHEFNFGLDLIHKIKSEAEFPILSANIYQKDTNNRFVTGTTTKEIDLDQDGTSDLTVGIIGLTTPHIPNWDGPKVASLDFKPLKEEAEKAVAELNGTADIIVASIHAGQEDADAAARANEVIENVSGIDAYILGHDHRSFAVKWPGPAGTSIPIGGPKDTGIEMVRIDLDVSKTNEGWVVDNGESSIIDTKTVAADEELKSLTREYHDTTRAFISEKIGTATADFLPKEEVKGIPEAQVGPTAMMSLVNNVQRKVTDAQISVFALLKADSKLPAGDLSYSNVFDLYKYSNTLVSTTITGKNLLTYMENNAAYYNTPNPEDLTISFNSAIRVYSYDIFGGVNYKIDISKPVGERIVNPTIDGVAIDPAATYTIAMNNYRYEGLLAQGLVSDKLLYDSDPETVRGKIAEYIKEKGTISPEEELEDNWEIIGYHFNENWRKLAVQLVNDGTLSTQPAADGRTPNVVPITKQDVIDAGYAPTSVTVMHTNDVHGRMEPEDKVLGMARLKTYKDLIQPELLLDAGDALQGLPISNYSNGLDMVNIMNEVGYDAMAVGNHEFDFGFDVVLQYKEKMNFPLLSSNVYKGNSRVFDPYTIIEKNGKKFAVIGVTTPETATKTHPNNVTGITFAEPITEVKTIIKELKNSNETIDSYIVLGHLGVDETTPTDWRGDTLAERLSTEFSDLNITVIDGHSHTAVQGGKRFGSVLYTQTGNYLNNVGLIDLDLADAKDSTAKLVSAQDLTGLAEDVAVKKLVDEAKAEFEAWGSEVVIKDNPYLFDGERENVRTRETNLGNLIGDAMLSYGQNGFSHPSDFAVTNGGGIRSNIEPGDITLGDIIAVLPFGNSISQIKVTGAQVREMFEMSVRSAAQKDATGKIILDDYGQPKLGANGGFLHVSSSIHVYYDSTKAGTLLANEDGNTTGETKVGERILYIEVLNQETGGFEALKDSESYYMATNDFLAAGGDGYDMLGGEREEGPSLDTVLIDYLKLASSAVQTVSASVNSRSATTGSNILTFSNLTTKAKTVNLTTATNAVDLANYKDPYPGERIISISEADFQNLNKVEPIPTIPETEDKTKDSNKDKPKGNYPETGDQIVSYLSLGAAFIGGSAFGVYYYNKKKKTA